MGASTASTALCRARSAVAALLACAAAPGCARLEAWPAGCGNAVVDPGEDCDGRFSTAGRCGAPDTEAACRWECGSGEACPSGFGCGVDGICRSASGRLDPGPTLEGDLVALSSVDADADGRADLVRRSVDELTVSFFADRAEVSQVSTRAPNAPAVVADLTGDRLAEVVTLTPHGVFVSGVTPKRSLAPHQYSTLPLEGGARLLAFDAMPPALRDEVVFFTADGVHIGPDRAAPVIDAGSFGDGAFDAATGELLEDPSAPCDELVVAVPSTRKLVVVTPCRDAGGQVQWNIVGVGHRDLPVVRTLDEIARAQNSNVPLVSVGDVNGDGHLDLVVSTSAGAEITYGVGDGTFHSTPDVPSADGDGATSRLTLVIDGAAAAVGAPLALGDVNGDGWADFVDMRGVLLTELDGTAHYLVAPPLGLARARLADLDGDGRVDILGTRETYAGLDEGALGSEESVLFYRGAGDGMFTEVPITVDGVLSAIAVADLDGDGTTDLALAVQRDEGGGGGGDGPTAASDIAIAWGRAGAAPADPEVIGSFSDVVQLVVGRISADDAPEDLVVVTGADALTAAVLTGGSDRQLRSPYELIDSAGLEMPTFGPLAGRFADRASPSLMLLTEAGASSAASGPAGAWHLALDSAGAIDATRSSAPAGLLVPPLFLGGGVAVDLDGDGADELVIPVNVDAHPVVQVLQHQGSELVLVHEATWLMSEGVFGTPVAQDLDADGRVDLLVATASHRLAVFWNEGVLAIDPDRATFVDAGAASTPGDGGAPAATAVFAFGALQLDADPEMEIVAATSDRVVVLDLDVATRAFRWASSLLGAPATTLAFASGDFDGDGVADLAAGEAARTTLLWGVPVLP